MDPFLGVHEALGDYLISKRSMSMQRYSLQYVSSGNEKSYTLPHLRPMRHFQFLFYKRAFPARFSSAAKDQNAMSELTDLKCIPLLEKASERDDCHHYLALLPLSLPCQFGVPNVSSSGSAKLYTRQSTHVEI